MKFALPSSDSTRRAHDGQLAYEESFMISELVLHASSRFLFHFRSKDFSRAQRRPQTCLRRTRRVPQNTELSSKMHSSMKLSRRAILGRSLAIPLSLGLSPFMA